MLTLLIAIEMNSNPKLHGRFKGKIVGLRDFLQTIAVPSPTVLSFLSFLKEIKLLKASVL